jgi:hypothetical protein
VKVVKRKADGIPAMPAHSMLGKCAITDKKFMSECASVYSVGSAGVGSALA